MSLTQAMRGMAQNNSVFQSGRSERVSKYTAKMMQTLASPLSRGEEAQPQPMKTIGPSQIFYDLDGPDGQLWYCTADLKCKEIEHEYYTEYVLTEYTYTVYDADFNEVGKIHDKMRYQKDEVRVPGPEAGIGILPVLTRNFFNSDDKYELVVSIAVNTTTPGFNHYRSVIYSLGGEKEKVTVERDGAEVEIEVDKPVSQLTSFVSDVLNASTDKEECFYMTFMSEFGIYPDIDFDKLIDGDEAEGKKYWNSISNNGYKFTLYGKADAAGKLSKVFEGSVTFQTMQGDQESTPVMLTFCHEGQPYILLPHYKDSFFNPYYSPFEDMTMRENNKLVVELYKINGLESSPVSTTEIAMEKGKGSGVLATYYSVGDLLYSGDVQFGEDGAPRYLVSRCNYTTASDETTDFCYYWYDVNGNKTINIFEGSESHLALTDVPGLDTQVMFVKYDYDEGYQYNFVDINKGYNKDTVKINYLLDTGFDDPEVLSFNIDRVPLAGTNYQYAFEMRAPLADEDDNNFIRIAWFNADGSFDRIDHVNIGQNVNYATVYINGVVLNPHFVDADDANEYMVLIKRGISSETSTAQEELVIAQPADQDLNGGRTLLHLTPCEKGTLQSISVYPAATDDTYRLFIGYNGRHGYTADFYDLPFATAGIDSVVADNQGGEIAYDGSTVRANGLAIKVYNTYGQTVAAGNGAVATENLPAGIYVAKAGKSALKFVVK